MNYKNYKKHLEKIKTKNIVDNIEFMSKSQHADLLLEIYQRELGSQYAQLFNDEGNDLINR